MRLMHRACMEAFTKWRWMADLGRRAVERIRSMDDRRKRYALGCWRGQLMAQQEAHLVFVYAARAIRALELDVALKKWHLWASHHGVGCELTAIAVSKYKDKAFTKGMEKIREYQSHRAVTETMGRCANQLCRYLQLKGALVNWSRYRMHRRRRRQNPAARFDEIDSNKDGVIDRTEWDRATRGA